MKTFFTKLKNLLFPPKTKVPQNEKPVNTSIPKHMIVAEGELGVKEFLKGENERISFYHSFTTLPVNLRKQSTAWCSSFVCFCLNKRGGNASARSWLNFGIPVNKNFKYGDIIVFWRESPTSWKGHVGFFVKQEGDYFYILGGNQDNMVCIKKYHSKYFLGARRVF